MLSTLGATNARAYTQIAQILGPFFQSSAIYVVAVDIARASANDVDEKIELSNSDKANRIRNSLERNLD